jgi:KDO2-lipid IV(A) lauroyltransferase
VTDSLTGRLADLGYAFGWRASMLAPEAWVGAALRAGAELGARRDGPGPRQLRANLARVLAARGAPVSDAELREVMRGALRSYARYWSEVFRLPRMDPSALYAAVHATVDGVAHLEAALDLGRGAVLALTHSGNWDVSGVYLVEWLRRRGEPATLVTVAERLRPESLYRRFVAYRESLGFEILPAEAGARTVATLAARLRANRVVCLLVDRQLGPGGVEVDFFGEPARMPGGPAQLARHTGASVLPVAGWFTPGGWGIRVHPPMPPPAGSSGSAIGAATQALADVFASDIAAHPLDWHMLQPIWTADRAPAPVLEPTW